MTGPRFRGMAAALPDGERGWQRGSSQRAFKWKFKEMLSLSGELDRCRRMGWRLVASSDACRRPPRAAARWG